MGKPVESERPAEAPRGRPRDLAIDEAVLGATDELIASVGYGRLSFDMVARRAGVTRPTIYRRWRNKPELVHAALFRRSRACRTPVTSSTISSPSPTGPPTHGPARVCARRCSDCWPKQRATTMLHATVMSSIEGPIRAWLAAVVGAAADRGEIRGDVDLDDVADLFMGPLFQHHVCNGRTDLGFGERGRRSPDDRHPLTSHCRRASGPASDQRITEPQLGDRPVESSKRTVVTSLRRSAWPPIRSVIQVLTDQRHDEYSQCLRQRLCPGNTLSYPR